MIQSLFNTIVTAITIYSLLCIARILMTWVPGSETSSGGKLLCSITDPYLNWFKRLSFARVGNLDFSPVIALGVLSVTSMTLSTIATTGKITIGYVAGSLVKVLWSFGDFLILAIIVLLAIRLVFDLMSRYSYSPFWTMIDRFLNRPIAWATKLFSRGKPLGYRGSLILTLVIFIVLRFALSYAVWYLIKLLHNLPF
jgi:YggT family protein